MGSSSRSGLVASTYRSVCRLDLVNESASLRVYRGGNLMGEISSKLSQEISTWSRHAKLGRNTELQSVFKILDAAQVAVEALENRLDEAEGAKR